MQLSRDEALVHHALKKCRKPEQAVGMLFEPLAEEEGETNQK